RTHSSPLVVRLTTDGGNLCFPRPVSQTRWWRLESVMRSDCDAVLGGRHLVFRVGERSYAISATCIEEIVPPAALLQPPAAPSFLSGFLKLGARLIAVVSLRRLWGMPDEEPGLYTPLIILKSEAPAIALEVDAAVQMVDFGDGLTPLAPGSSFNDCAVAL